MSARDFNPDTYAVTMKALAEGWKRQQRLSISQWSDKYRRLPAKSSSEPGQWRTERIPFLRAIMDDLSPDSPIQRVVFMKSSQVGGTECGINWVGSFMMQSKGSMLVIQPTIAMAEKWSTQRLDTSIADSPEWATTLPPRKARDKDNQTLQKEGAGFILFITGANSASSLASMPIMYVFADEVDRYPDDVEDEGDPLSLALRRQKTFQRRKKTLIVSTPTIKDASRIEREYKNTDQRQYYVPCPHCGELQTLKWKQLQWDSKTENVWYACEANGCVIEEHAKATMLPEEGYGGKAKWIGSDPNHTDRGYFINALYTPLGLGDTWHDLVFGPEGWLAAQGNPSKLKTFVNTVFGESWEDLSSTLKTNELLTRREPWKVRTIPRGCLMLTCGVDTQDDRLEFQIIGHGRNGAMWVIDTHIIWGSPAQDQTWQELSEWLDKPIVNSFGVPLKIIATAIDSGGHHTQAVYNFCRWNQHRRIVAIKGASTANRPALGKPTYVDINWQGQVHKEGVQLWTVGTDTLKSHIMGLLKVDADLPQSERKIHFSADLEEDYFDQLTSEAFDPSKNKWVKRAGRRNEGLDTFVYAIAAAHLPGVEISKSRESNWQYLEHLLEPTVRDMFAADPPEEPQKTEVEAQKPNPADAGFFIDHAESNHDEADDYWRGR